MRAAAKLGIWALALVALCAAAAGAKEVEEPTTALVSRAGNGAGGSGPSRTPSISADGRYVAFASRAKNFPGGDGKSFQVYVKDMNTGALSLVSRADGPNGPAAASADSPSISGDGRYVAFEAPAGLNGEPGGVNAVFVRDLAAGTTTLVSRATGPLGAPADDSSGSPSISADGRHVAFESEAGNLSAEDTDEPIHTDVFVRDLDTGVTELVSRPTGAGPAATGGEEPSISADGRYVAFASKAQLVADDADEEPFPSDVFLRDRLTATTILVSRANGAAGAASKQDSEAPSISADGLRVAFASDAKLTEGIRFHGPFVFLRDIATGTTVWVSAGDDGAAGDPYRRPSISADGRFVAFQTRGNKLSSTDADGRVDVFVRDLAKRLTLTVSRASGRFGVPGDGPSFDAAVSADGSFIAFTSHAANFSAADDDGVSDVFRRRPVYAKEPALLRCAGRVATIIGTPARDVLKGSKRKDVVVALGGDDRISTFTRADVVCAGAGRDRVDAGDNGEGGGFDLVRGGPGGDRIVLGPELGHAFGEGGNDVLIGSKGGDNIYGGPGDDLIRGGPNPFFNTDFLFGGPGDDRIYGGPGPNEIEGGPGRDLEVGKRR